MTEHYVLNKTSLNTDIHKLRLNFSLFHESTVARCLWEPNPGLFLDFVFVNLMFTVFCLFVSFFMM